jgi:adenylylsulfate kinase-like enzyme
MKKQSSKLTKKHKSMNIYVVGDKPKPKVEVPKKVVVTFGGEKASGKSSLMRLLMKSLKREGIKYDIGIDEHSLCIETKRQEIINLIKDLK